jgi:hypothetical protein
MRAAAVNTNPALFWFRHGFASCRVGDDATVVVASWPTLRRCRTRLRCLGRGLHGPQRFYLERRRIRCGKARCGTRHGVDWAVLLAADHRESRRRIYVHGIRPRSAVIFATGPTATPRLRLAARVCARLVPVEEAHSVIAVAEGTGYPPNGPPMLTNAIGCCGGVYLCRVAGRRLVNAQTTTSTQCPVG